MNEQLQFNYTLQGNAETINGIRTMIDDLCQKFGTPDNEQRLFVPLGILMLVLVGSDAYRGNILRMEQPSPNRLIIQAEVNSGEPLLYALRECFDNLEITMKETE